MFLQIGFSGEEKHGIYHGSHGIYQHSWAHFNNIYKYALLYVLSLYCILICPKYNYIAFKYVKIYIQSKDYHSKSIIDFEIFLRKVYEFFSYTCMYDASVMMDNHR